MKSFDKWCELKKYSLDFVSGEETTSESTASKRAGVRGYAYPKQYKRGQYPAQFFIPGSADAVTYLDMEKGGE